jgi:hypothetical protein
VLVTRDCLSYAQLTVRFFADGRAHTGVVLLSPQLCRQGPEAMAQALAQLTESHDAVPPYAAEWLDPLPDEQLPTGDARS